MALGIADIDSAIQQFGLDPEEMAKRMGAKPQLQSMPAPPRPALTAPGAAFPSTQAAPAGKVATNPQPVAPASAGPGKTAPMPVSAPPATPGMSMPTPGPAQQRLEADQAKGAPKLHGVGKVFDTIGQIAAPGIEERVPGSVGNYWDRVGKEAGAAKEEQAGRAARDASVHSAAENVEATSRTGLNDAEAQRDRNLPTITNEFEMWASQNPDKPISEYLHTVNAAKMPSNEFELALRQNPNLTAAEYMHMQAENNPATKPRPEIIAQIGERPQPGQKNEKGLTDEEWGKKAQQITQDEGAASANARGEAYGNNRPANVLDTQNGNRPVIVKSGEAEAHPDRYVTQSGGQSALPKEALINDIRVSAQNVQKNIDVLGASGFDRATLASALADPATTFESYLQAIPRGMLDDRGQQFVSDLFNLREQAMAMRSVLGAGAGSEDMRRAILSTLPSIASNPQMGAKQLQNLFQVLDRVQQGVPTVPLAAPNGGPNRNPGAPAANDPLGIR